ncbi:fatty-acid amide hydrolase 2 [Trichonephila clavipes]|nr:fatty-acid amide hydrolase 2 [Trichonephila clavipes]
MPLLLGLVSNLGTHPIPEPTLIPYISTGPMCRYAEDLIISMRVLSSQSGIPVDFGQMVDFKNLKIYYMKEIRSPMIAPVDSDIALALKSCASPFVCIYIASHIQRSEMISGGRADSKTQESITGWP